MGENVKYGNLACEGGRRNGISQGHLFELQFFVRLSVWD